MENKGSQLSTRKSAADEVIKRHTYWAVGAGLIPIPLVDIAAVTAIQLDMFKSICGVYNADYSKEQGQSWIGALVGSTLSSVFARIGASALKSIPLIGSIVGMASMSIMSGATTYALGQVVTKHFEEGGTIESFNAEKVKALYNQKVEEGKKLAIELKEKYKNFANTKGGKAKETDATAKLKELEQLKANNLISEEEYNTMRANILKTFLDD